MNVTGDFLIIGSGIAGLRAAITLAEAGEVIVLTKAEPAESNTGYAQGGIAVAIGPDDSPGLHARDTIAAGDGLCDDQAVRLLVTDGPRYVHELIGWGAAFDREADGSPSLAREGAHSVRRVLHARDTTGREIARVLWERVAAHPKIRVIDDALATDLIVDRGVCTGTVFVDRSRARRTARAGATLLATGGAGQVFRDTTNPAIATGDGIAMAYHAGARATDLEFVQFHPTVLSVPGAPRFLLSEALRGEGARLVNHAGEPFAQRYHPAGDLASRDVVSRAMVREADRTGQPVYLTMAHLDAGFVRERFPTLVLACRDRGLDLAVDRIPVSPAAHYAMGGVETDTGGRTTIPGLFAAGEVACTGVHGANRLASNSLLEGLVFGARAAEAMCAPRAGFAGKAHEVEHGRHAATGGAFPTEAEVRELMWRDAGLVRSGEPLRAAVNTLTSWYGAMLGAGVVLTSRADRRLFSIITVGLLVASAALRREESRGGHFRADFPERDDLHWMRHIAQLQ